MNHGPDQLCQFMWCFSEQLEKKHTSSVRGNFHGSPGREFDSLSWFYDFEMPHFLYKLTILGQYSIGKWWEIDFSFQKILDWKAEGHVMACLRRLRCSLIWVPLCWSLLSRILWGTFWAASADTSKPVSSDTSYPCKSLSSFSKKKVVP